MNNVTIGKSRKKSQSSQSYHSDQGGMLFVIGLSAICLSLIFPMANYGGDYGDILPVMSTSVSQNNDETREELRLPEKDVSAQRGESSIFEYIGEFFADIIRGD